MSTFPRFPYKKFPKLFSEHRALPVQQKFSPVTAKIPQTSDQSLCDQWTTAIVMNRLPQSIINKSKTACKVNRRIWLAAKRYK